MRLISSSDAPSPRPDGSTSHRHRLQHPAGCAAGGRGRDSAAAVGAYRLACQRADRGQLVGAAAHPARRRRRPQLGRAECRRRDAQVRRAGRRRRMVGPTNRGVWRRLVPELGGRTVGVAPRRWDARRAVAEECGSADRGLRPAAGDVARRRAHVVTALLAAPRQDPHAARVCVSVCVARSQRLVRARLARWPRSGVEHHGSTGWRDGALLRALRPCRQATRRSRGERPRL